MGAGDRGSCPWHEVRVLWVTEQLIWEEREHICQFLKHSTTVNAELPLTWDFFLPAGGFHLLPWVSRGQPLVLFGRETFKRALHQLFPKNSQTYTSFPTTDVTAVYSWCSFPALSGQAGASQCLIFSSTFINLKKHWETLTGAMNGHFEASPTWFQVRRKYSPLHKASPTIPPWEGVKTLITWAKQPSSGFDTLIKAPATPKMPS